MFDYVRVINFRIIIIIIIIIILKCHHQTKHNTNDDHKLQFSSSDFDCTCNI